MTRSRWLALAGVLVALLAGCSSGTRLTPAMTACTGAAGQRTMSVYGTTRTFIEHRPNGFSATTRYPAIVAFPGRGESAGRLEGYSQLDGVNAIVLYAQGLPGQGGPTTWEATPYLGPKARDYEFANDLVTWLARAPCVDPSRIDFTGKSDGAGFAASAACANVAVAAVGTVSGAFYQGLHVCGSATPRSLPMINFHGTADSVIPYGGDPARKLYSTDAWLAVWHQRDACTGPGTDVTVAPDIVRSTWSACAPGTEVVNYRIVGGGHTWAGATADSCPGADTQAIDAAQLLAAFFLAHPHADG